jgi:hypothetical protein
VALIESLDVFADQGLLSGGKVAGPFAAAMFTVQLRPMAARARR